MDLDYHQELVGIRTRSINEYEFNLRSFLGHRFPKLVGYGDQTDNRGVEEF